MEAATQKRWIWRGENSALKKIDLLRASLGVSFLTAQVLFLRGVDTPEKGRDFLESSLSALPDPFLMKGMEQAVERLVQAIEKGERIAVHGDYDVDGITGTALLVETLCAFGAIVEYHIPLRLKDGYGLSAKALQKSAVSGAKVVLTVDCGVSAIAEARLAAALGLDLIITDHHQPPDILPQAYAILNPCLPDCRFPFREPAGVGVAFFLLIALRKVLRNRGAFADRPEPNLRQSLDLVALGTIADLVPLKGINRSMARVGLSLLSKGFRPGIQALKQVSGVKEVSCGVVGFRLAPRLNAAGRLEDAAKGVELLLETSPMRAMETAQLLDDLNRQRQNIEQEALRQAVQRLEGEQGKRSIVLADARWHPGVIGIVASRLVERYCRPAVLIALENGQGKGSARSIDGFHLYRALDSCREHLAGFGGHEYAAGLTIDAEQVESFAKNFEKVAKDVLNDEDLLPRLIHDGEVLLEDLSMETVEELGNLAPFGAGNPEPSFVALGIRIQQVRTVGENHLRFTARQADRSLSCIAFGMASRQKELQGETDILFTPSINEWRRNVSVQLRVKDFRQAGKSPSPVFIPDLHLRPAFSRREGCDG
jgi:single-stranded-DNA-specific exonuclease